MQRNEAASLNIFLVNGQEEGTISDEDYSLAGRLDLVDGGFSQRFTTTLLQSISISGHGFKDWLRELMTGLEGKGNYSERGKRKNAKRDTKNNTKRHMDTE